MRICPIRVVQINEPFHKAKTKSYGTGFKCDVTVYSNEPVIYGFSDMLVYT